MSMPSIGNAPYGPLDLQNALLPSMEQPSAGLGSYGPAFALGGDNVGTLWPAANQFSQDEPFGEPDAPSTQGGGIWNSLAGLINGFGSFLQSSIGSIGNAINALGAGTFGTSSSASPNAAGYGEAGYGANGYGANGYGWNGYGANGYGANGYGANGYGDGSDGGTYFGNGPSAECPPNGRQQQPFGTASFQSDGDPHDSFDGSTPWGRSVEATWNDTSPRSRPDLLRSDSFAGGLRVSTQTGAPIDANGTHYNSSATVSTDGGNTQVTYDKDGSYSVTSYGQNVQLTPGQATSLGNGETVTLNSDGSLTVDDTNAAGGSIALQLSTSDGGQGVNVGGTSSGIALGGYLVRGAEDGASGSSGYAPFAPFPGGGSFAGNPELPITSYPNPNYAVEEA